MRKKIFKIELQNGQQEEVDRLNERIRGLEDDKESLESEKENLQN